MLTALLAVISVVGCSNSNAPHGGLVADISGANALNAGKTESYDFDASSAMGYKLFYGIDWGDGSKPLFIAGVSSGNSVSGNHAWAQPGTYTIAVTVTDGHGESGFSTYEVQVNPAPPPEPTS